MVGGLLGWIDTAEVVPGVDAGVVAVGEADAEGVVADEFGVEGDERAAGAGGGGEDGERVFGHLVAEVLHVGGGGHFAEVGDGVVGGAAIGPLDGEAAIFLEVEPGGCVRRGLVRRRGGHRHILAAMGAQTTQNRRPFVDALVEAIGRAGSPICVGLDPVLEKLPESVKAEHWEPPKAIEAFCTGVVDAVAGIAPVVKLQSACFERYGATGVRVLEHVAAHARAKGVLVLLDAKRGDIGISAEHYAAAAVGLHADAITVSGYMGPSTIEPYLRAGLGVFVLVRTSNPDSDVVQGAALKDGRSVAGMMGEMVAELGKGWMGASGGTSAGLSSGLSSVGAVVGATKAADGRMLREIMPGQVFLVPGYGAQGGTAEDVRALVRPGARGAGDAGVLVTASRSVIYPAGGSAGHSGDWRTDICEAARRLATEIGDIVRA